MKKQKKPSNFRFDPKLKYIAEIASRVQNTNLTVFLENSMRSEFKKIYLRENETLHNWIDALWDLSESARMIKLAFIFPTLLNYEEQSIFRMIQRNFSHFKIDAEEFIASSKEDEIRYAANIADLHFIDFDKVEHYWDDLLSCVHNEDNLNLNKSSVLLEAFKKMDEDQKDELLVTVMNILAVKKQNK